MKTEAKIAILKSAAQKIKSFGFKVYICVNKNSGFAWGTYSDGKTVGGFDVDDFRFVSVKIHHRPATDIGTGFCVKDELLVDEITKSICLEGLSFCPRWWNGPMKNIVKYTPEEFFKEDSEKWGYNYEEI